MLRVKYICDQITICIFFFTVGEQTTGSWECLCKEHFGGKVWPRGRKYTLHQAERPRNIHECPYEGRLVLTKFCLSVLIITRKEETKTRLLPFPVYMV